MSAFVQLSRVLATAEPGSLWFECPGCGVPHRIMHGAGEGPRWGWNGDAERPTFTPSILAQWNEPSGAKCCHSFVTDGQIQFLGDCTHALAWQTVAIPEWDTE